MFISHVFFFSIWQVPPAQEHRKPAIQVLMQSFPLVHSSSGRQKFEIFVCCLHLYTNFTSIIITVVFSRFLPRLSFCSISFINNWENVSDKKRTVWCWAWCCWGKLSYAIKTQVGYLYLCPYSIWELASATYCEPWR